MTGTDIWNVVRWCMGLYLIGLGAYAVATRHMPWTSKPRWTWPFPRRTEHDSRQSTILGLICILLGFAILFVKPG